MLYSIDSIIARIIRIGTVSKVKKTDRPDVKGK